MSLSSLTTDLVEAVGYILQYPVQRPDTLCCEVSAVSVDFMSYNTTLHFECAYTTCTSTDTVFGQAITSWFCMLEPPLQPTSGMCHRLIAVLGGGFRVSVHCTILSTARHTHMHTVHNNNFLYPFECCE